ncbi:MAG: 3-keto-disaccharide hydrolase [Verrucomicrobiales bacterium]
MKLIFSFIAFSILLTLQSTADDGELKSIFNGKDLTGWDVPDNNIWFTVKDGVLKLENGPQKKGQTLWTSDEYENFEMEFDFKMGKGTVDSGVYVRNSREQIQIGISGSLKRDMTGSPYISGKGYPVEAKGVKELLKLDDWNTMKICAEGKKYTVWLGGEKIMTYESDSAIKKGKIGIQLHGNRVMSIEYRNLKARSLK